MLKLNPGHSYRSLVDDSLFGLTITNTSKKPIYIRCQPASIKISDRPPAAYGVKKIQVKS